MIAEFNWKNDNGNRVYAVEWQVDRARAVIGIIHGLGEHSRRYDHLAEFFAGHRIAMIGYDRQGFGRSEGKKGFAADYREYLDEVAQLLVVCGRRYPNRPIFLYGQSMGGQVLLQYLINRKPHIAGAIVSSPHIATSFTPNRLLVGFGRLMRKLSPSFTVDNQLELDKLSRDPHVGLDYQTDEYNHQRLSSQTGIDIIERAEQLNQYRAGLPVPTLLMHGDADGITSHDASAAFAARNPAKVTFKSWPGFYHELHNEPERAEVLRYVLGWIEDHLQNTHS